MADFYILFNGERMEITESSLLRYELAIQDTELERMFFQYVSTSINENLTYLLKHHLNGNELDESWRYFLYQKNKEKKKNWKAKAFRDVKQRKLKTAKELFRLYKEYSADYSDEEIEERLKPYRRKITEWEESDDTFLYQYPFFDEKTEKMQEVSMIDDLALDYLNYLKHMWEEELKDKSKAVNEYPYDNQLVWANEVQKSVFDPDGYMEHDGKEKPYKEFGPAEGALRVLIESNPMAEEMANEFDLEKDVYDLDPVDIDVLTTVLSYRKESFATDKLIEVKLGDLVKDVFKSASSKNYTLMLRRIYKLQLLRIGSISYENAEDVMSNDWARVELMGFFDYVSFQRVLNKSNKEEIYLTIDINRGIHNRFINNQTLRIYKEQVSGLDYKYHSMLLYMQKERIKAYRAGKTVVSLTYTNFLSNIRFKYSSKSKIGQEISDSLQQIISADILVNWYEARKDRFVIEFKPISEQEVLDILGEVDSKIELEKLVPQTDETTKRLL